MTHQIFYEKEYAKGKRKIERRQIFEGVEKYNPWPFWDVFLRIFCPSGERDHPP